MSKVADLQGKVAVVTGVSAGMGKAIAKSYLAAGMMVVGTGRHGDTLEQMAAEVSADERKRLALVVSDVSRSEDNQALLALVMKDHGRLDVLVNNAGVMDNMTPVGDVSDELWEQVLGINLRGPFELCRGAVQIMLQQGSGNIINIASGGGIGGGRAGAAYIASKFALVGLSKNIAYMYAHKGIRCNVICPGGVKTDIGASMGNIHPFGMERVMKGAENIRIGEAQEIGEIALFLASDQSSLINGVSLLADAGRSAW